MIPFVIIQNCPARSTARLNTLSARVSRSVYLSALLIQEGLGGILTAVHGQKDTGSIGQRVNKEN